jgi:hypothetical protein
MAALLTFELLAIAVVNPEVEDKSSSQAQFRLNKYNMAENSGIVGPRCAGNTTSNHQE